VYEQVGFGHQLFVIGMVDAMYQAKTLAMFDLYHFLMMIKEMWAKGECTGADFLHQMLMYLIPFGRRATKKSKAYVVGGG
jgi:hypothetical protein